MRIKSLDKHLRPYIMHQRRRTTINHAFAAAVAPSDIYEEKVVAQAIRLPGQDPKRDLRCAYCGALAETWDHVAATVRQSRFSGNGHRLGNLLPCCKPCNSRKGNKAWDDHLCSLNLDQHELETRRGTIERYLAAYAKVEHAYETSPDLERLESIRHQVLSLLVEGDAVAARVRASYADGAGTAAANVENG